MSRYVVTGAAGFIGSHLVEALLGRGDDVVAVDCVTDSYDPWLKEENARSFDVRRIDVAEEDLELDGVEGVFHLAAEPGVRSSFDRFDLYVRRNVVATQRVLERAAAAGVRVVLASSSSVYGDAERLPTREDAEPRPLSPYGITKLACEHLAHAYAVDGVVLRYFTVYGPRQRPDMAFARVIAALREGTEFELYGDASRAFTFVGDVVEATVTAMDDAPSHAVYNVGGGEEATMHRAIALLEEIAERELHVRELERARGDARRTSADLAKIRDELGWSPRTSLAAGLQAQWSWAADRVSAR